jgi:two-component system, chemotaxis family, protein-glutamate methylesterase/glutaminase
VTRPTRILVCEDSATYALGLKRFLETGGDIDVVAICSTGEEAIEALPHVSPDLVTMDLDLPGMGGIRAVEKIMRTHPVPILVLSGQVRRGSIQAAEALTAGAVEALPKGHVHVDDPAGPAAVALRYRFRRLAAARVGQDEAPAVPTPRARVEQRRNGAKAIGICASTGGPRALEIVLAGLPATFPIPVLVVQHMTRGFTEGLASWLDRLVPPRVGLAADGQGLTPGVWVAPDDAHLVVQDGMTLGLDADTRDGHHRPSGDVLLESMARAVGPGAVAVVLSGMGRDGARGVTAVRRAGGRAIAQDESSSAIFGMPRAAADAGADMVLPVSGIAPALLRMAPLETVA